MRSAVAVVAGLIAITCATGAAADEPPASSPPVTGEEGAPVYRLSAATDVPLLLLAASVSASWFLAFELAPPYCAPRCNPERLNFLDKPAAGLYSTTWGYLGDAATVTVLASMPVWLIIAEGPVHGLNDTVVIGESILFASATQVLLSYATSRPRPRLYGTEAPDSLRDDGQAARSFPSGHTATGFAGTLATFFTLQRLNRPALSYTALGIGLAGSSFLSVARVGAGSHFPTDVAAGVAVGAAFGILVPALHPTTSEGERAARGLPTRVRFMPMAGADIAGGSLIGAF